MKFNRLFLLLIAFICLFCTGCRRKRMTPLCVTYEVKTYGAGPCRTILFYSVDTGVVCVDTNARSWSKKVCLPVGRCATLLAYPSADPHLSDRDAEPGERFAYTKATVSVAIIHEKKTVSSIRQGYTGIVALGQMDVVDTKWASLISLPSEEWSMTLH